MKPKIKQFRDNTYHTDGTVSFWNVYHQQWERRQAEDISDKVLESMSDYDRRRIAQHAATSGRKVEG